MQRQVTARSFLDLAEFSQELLASLSTLHGLGNLKIDQADERELLGQALRELIQHYGMERCSIYLCEEDGLVKAANLDWLGWQRGEIWSEDHSSTLHSVPEGMMWSALQAGGIRMDPERGEELTPDPSVGEREESGRGSTICIPLSAGGDVIGVLNLFHPQPDHFGEWQLRLLRLFGVFLGQALTANRMLRKLDQEVQARTRHLQTILEETRHLEEHYRELSMLDELTGLHNRRYFFSKSRLALGLAVRHRHPLTLMLMDLDRFKKVNDTYGHGAGDLVLQSLGQALKKHLRQTDILARVGGEEFAVFLPETCGEGAQDLAGRLLAEVRKLHWPDIDNHLRITMSLGMVTLGPDQFPQDLTKLDLPGLFDQLFTQADRGMYLSKADGGDGALQMPWPPPLTVQ